MRLQKRICRAAVCIFLIFAMVLPLTACQKKGKQTATIDRNTIYREELLDIKLPSNFNVYNCNFTKDKIYFYGYEYNETDYTGYSAWGNVNLDGTDLRIHKFESQNSWIENFLISNEGNVYLICTESIEDTSDPENYIYENNYYLKEFDASGKEVATVNLKEKYGAEWMRDVKVLPDGNVLMITGDKYVVLDKNLKEIKSKAYEMFDGTLYTVKDGSLINACWDESGYKLFRFDVDKFERGEEIQLPFNLTNYGIRDGGGKYDLIFTDSTQLYVYNIGDSSLTTLMNFVNSDLLAYSFSAVMPVDETTIYGYYNYYDEYEEGGNSAKFGKYTKVDPDSIPEKKLLSLGCLWVDSEVRKRIINFNKNNSEYRIVISDYSQYDTEEDWYGGVNKLNSDIASGQAPDIVFTDNSDTIHNYITKGLFMDLTDYIKNDPDIDYDDIFPNLIKASSYNDKLYELVPSFTISTVAGKKSVLGDRKSWTMEEFLQFKNSLQPGMSMFADTTRESILSSMLTVNVGDYMDFGKGRCYFDTPEFISLLEYIKEFPTAEDMYTDEYWENYDYESAESAYRENKVVLSPTAIYDIRETKYLIRGTFGEAVTFIGYPCKEGNGSAIVPSSSIAISAKSAYKDAAWEFVRYYLTNEYQSNTGWGIPASMKVFDEKAKDAQTKPYYTDESGKRIEYDDTYYINGQEVVIEPLTAEEVAEIKEFVMSVDRISSYNDEIGNIISEDAQPFFEGQKSAEEVAKVIQSRVNIYINEKQ